MKEKSKIKESAVLREVLAHLSRHPNVAWHVRMSVARTIAKSGRWVSIGRPGMSDIIGQLRDGRFLAIEVKTPRGKLTEQQANFLKLVAANGGAAYVARSVEDLKDLDKAL